MMGDGGTSNLVLQRDDQRRPFGHTPPTASCEMRILTLGSLPQIFRQSASHKALLAD
jgi:hypothetical protein